MSSVEQLIGVLMDKLSQIAQTRTVVGDAIQVEEVTLLPISKVSIGFGAGGGGEQAKHGGSGMGGGISIEPIAFVAIVKGKPHLLPLKKEREGMGWGRLLEMAPDLADKVLGAIERARRRK
ncbi:MAG TPA: hypothetical protein EYP17_07630 [Candidatus Latescibacteria bacterium]|nr:hypothetical protein [Candidatus Latescibacterota bacterium]